MRRLGCLAERGGKAYGLFYLTMNAPPRQNAPRDSRCTCKLFACKVAWKINELSASMAEAFLQREDPC